VKDQQSLADFKQLHILRWPMRPPIRRRLIVIILSICAQDGATSPLASPAGNAMRSKRASTAVLVIGHTVKVMVIKCWL
jgi:hypothetical protein